MSLPAAKRTRAWWTSYYEPLEAQIRAIRARQSGTANLERLIQHEHEIAMVKAAPEQFACGFFIIQANAWSRS